MPRRIKCMPTSCSSRPVLCVHSPTLPFVPASVPRCANPPYVVPNGQWRMAYAVPLTTGSRLRGVSWTQMPPPPLPLGLALRCLIFRFNPLFYLLMLHFFLFCLVDGARGVPEILVGWVSSPPPVKPERHGLQEKQRLYGCMPQTRGSCSLGVCNDGMIRALKSIAGHHRLAASPAMLCPHHLRFRRVCRFKTFSSRNSLLKKKHFH